MDINQYRRRVLAVRLEKFLVGSANIILLVLTLFALFKGGAGLCLSVSGLWFVLALLTLPGLYRTYYDRLSRNRAAFMVIPGLILAAVATASSPSDELWAPSLLTTTFWGFIALACKNQGNNFKRVGHGYLPGDAWINPPAEVIREGDVILTGGRMAQRTRNSVGHMELVLRQDGRLVVFSSYMEQGVVFHSLRALCYKEQKRSHYIVMRSIHGFSEEQNRRAVELAVAMYEENQRWTKAQVQIWNESGLAEATAFADRYLPEWLCAKPVFRWFLPGWRAMVLRSPTGYDWQGPYDGQLRDSRWTCMGADMKVLIEVGVPIRPHGTGACGMGTGKVNPLMPVRMIDDPDWHLLTTEDEQQLRKRV